MKNIKVFEQFINEAKFNAKKIAKELEEEYPGPNDNVRVTGKNQIEFEWWGADDKVEVFVDCDQQQVFIEDDNAGEWNSGKIKDFSAATIMDAVNNWNSYN